METIDSLLHLHNFWLEQLREKNKDMEFKTTKERILKAASKCEDAKKVLKELYPEAFEDDKYFDLSNLKAFPFSHEESKSAGFSGNCFFQVRDGGKYKNKGFYLSSRFNWDKVIDDEGCEVLVPTKKN